MSPGTGSAQEPREDLAALEDEALGPAMNQNAAPIRIGGYRPPPDEGVDRVGRDRLAGLDLQRDDSVPGVDQDVVLMPGALSER